MESLPTWERGLKLTEIRRSYDPGTSLPTWERGLKPVVVKIIICLSGRSLRGSVD